LKQFSHVSSVFITRDDRLYAIDSESSPERQPELEDPGVRIGTPKDDRVLQFIPPYDNKQFQGAAGEGIAVDPDGNVYATKVPISRPVAGGGLRLHPWKPGGLQILATIRSLQTLGERWGATLPRPPGGLVTNNRGTRRLPDGREVGSAATKDFARSVVATASA